MTKDEYKIQYDLIQQQREHLNNKEEELNNKFKLNAKFQVGDIIKHKSLFPYYVVREIIVENFIDGTPYIKYRVWDLWPYDNNNEYWHNIDHGSSSVLETIDKEDYKLCNKEIKKWKYVKNGRWEYVKSNVRKKTTNN